MTRPRIVEAGATLALSRRTTRRHFLLHPDEARQMEQVYWYCLAYAAQLHGVLVHAACLMSTHCHEVITDVRGEYPKPSSTLSRTSSPIRSRPGRTRCQGTSAPASSGSSGPRTTSAPTIPIGPRSSSSGRRCRALTVCGGGQSDGSDRSGPAPPGVHRAVRASARGMDPGRPQRVLPRGHLVDAGVPRSAVRAGAVAPRQT